MFLYFMKHLESRSCSDLHNWLICANDRVSKDPIVSQLYSIDDSELTARTLPILCEDDVLEYESCIRLCPARMPALMLARNIAVYTKAVTREKCLLWLCCMVSSLAACLCLLQ